MLEKNQTNIRINEMLNAIIRFLNGINCKYIKPWFFSSDDPGRIKAPYVISFVFITLTVFSIIIQIIIKLWQFRVIKDLWDREGVNALQQIDTISRIDMSLIPLISILIGTAGMFIGLYNWGKKESGDNLQLQIDKIKSENISGDGRIRENEI